MSRDDPKPSRPPQRTPPSFEPEDGRRRGRVPMTTMESDSQPDEDAGDENTWVAGGSPYTTREHTAEVSYFEETETNIDWNGPSVPGMASEDTLNFDARPASGEAGHGDYPTEPGYGTDAGSLSALRDAMRGPSRSRSVAALQLPPPRARTNPGLRGGGVPPVRRAGPPGVPGVPGAPPAAPRARGPGGTTPPPPRRRRSALASTLGPIVAAAVVVLFLGLLALRMLVGGAAPEEVDAPMLPVVGGPTPTDWPPPPFDISAPQPFRPALLGAQVDLATAPTRIVELAAAGDAAQAAALADRYVRTENRPATYFELGALLAAAGEVDSAMYWIVRSSQESGFPPVWLVKRREFAALWQDSRWDAFVRWAVVQGRFYAARSAGPATIVTPSSLEAAVALDAARRGSKAPAKGGKPVLPVLIWLDGVGGNGSSVLAWGQQIADDLGVIVVGVGGPERVGPAGGWWSSDPTRDREHVAGALAAVTSVELDPTRRYLAGLGQGAQYAVELVLRDPTFAAGALALSPSDDWTGERDKAGEGQKARRQKVSLATGALVPSVHTLLRLDLGRLQRAKVDVSMKIDEAAWAWPDLSPPELGARVGTWLAGQLSPQTAAAKPSPGGAAPATVAEGPQPAPAAVAESPQSAAPTPTTPATVSAAAPAVAAPAPPATVTQAQVAPK
jgi:hypothetical protein